MNLVQVITGLGIDEGQGMILVLHMYVYIPASSSNEGGLCSIPPSYSSIFSSRELGSDSRKSQISSISPQTTLTRPHSITSKCS